MLAPVTLLALVAACTGDDEPEASTEAFCARLEELADLSLTFDRVAVGELRTRSEDLGHLAEVAPESIRSDVEVLVGYLDDLISELEGVESGDAEATAQAFRALESRVAEVEEAGGAVEGFAREQCGLDLRAPSNGAGD